MFTFHVKHIKKVYNILTVLMEHSGIKEKMCWSQYSSLVANWKHVGVDLTLYIVSVVFLLLLFSILVVSDLRVKA